MVATLCQAFVSDGNSIASVNEPGNAFKFTLPAPVGANNLLLCKITSQSGSTLTTLNDSINGNWSTTALVTADAGAGNNQTNIYLFPGAAAGVTTFTITFGASQQPAMFTVQEWAGIATTTPAAGHNSTAGLIGSALTTGAFTPTNNDGTGGNLIVAFFDFSDAASAASNPSSFVAGGSFTLHDADIAWNNNQGLPKAASYFVQTASASINPAMTATGDTLDHFNCVALALKLSSGTGTVPTGLRISKYIEQFNSAQSAATWVLQMPTVGNLRVLATSAPNASNNITSVTDSESNTWTNLTPQADVPQFFYFKNAAANAGLTVTVHITGAAGTQIHCALLDIGGAATGTAIGATGFAGSTGANSVTSVAHQPDITPTQSNSMIFAMLADGLGPVSAITAPAGNQSDILSYTGWTDSSNYSSGDGWGHIYNTSTAAQSWTWTIPSQPSNSVASFAAEILAAPTGAATTMLLTGVG